MTLDFREVQWVRETALAALIPALASLHGRRVSVRGLEDADDELRFAAVGGLSRRRHAGSEGLARSRQGTMLRPV